jgi:hypothetical protein
MKYSYRGQEPKKLPLRFRLDNGEVRTSLNELDSSQLEELGFTGPFERPHYDIKTQKVEWIDGQYVILDLTEEELEKLKQDQINLKLKHVNYNVFWNKLTNSSIYKKLRAASLQSLSANTLCTELISLFGDAKSGNPNIETIQYYMNILFLNFSFTVEEIEELKQFMEETNLDVQYTLPNEEYLSTHTYDPETNMIISSSQIN